MDFLTSDGAFTKITTSSDSDHPDTIYNNWCTELGLTSTSAGLDADDTAWLIRATPGENIRALGSTDKLGFSSEGTVEIFKVEPSNSTSQDVTIPNLFRSYTTTASVPRMCISFHPGYDSGSASTKRAQNDRYFLFSGMINRSSPTNPTVYFALRLEYGVGFTLALKLAYKDSIPIYVFEIGANNSAITKQSLIATLSSSDANTLVVNGDYRYGMLSGTVIDEAGLPAQRKIRCYDRATGKLLYKTQSNVDGSYAIPALTDGEMYVVALDDDLPPSLNALILDRITYN